MSESSKFTPQEERTQSELKRDIPLPNQEEPKSSSNSTSDDQSKAKPTSPLPPISVWAIPFLSMREALQLYQMLDEDSKARAKVLVSIYGVQVVSEVLSFKECQEYFGESGLFEHAKKINFQRSFIDPRCFEKLPKTLIDLSWNKSHLMHSEIWLSGKIWVGVLENIVNRAPHLQSLRIHLEIDSFIEEEAAQVLAQGKLTQLTHLDLGGNWIGSEGIKAIATGNFRNLTYLDVSSNSVKDDAIQAIAENMTQLRYLILRFNEIGSKGALALAHGKLENLTHLDLSQNKIEALGAEAIFQGNLPSMTHLDMSYNKIGSTGALAAAYTNLKNLTHLNLYSNQIGRKEAQTLVEKLTYLTYLNFDV